MKTQVISKQLQDFTTNTNEGQEDYVLLPEAHKIVGVKVNNKTVEFEVFLRLKRVPKRYGQMLITIEDKIS